MGHRDQASTQGTAHGCMDRQEQATHVPRQTWGSMVSLGGVFTFRSLLSLCCGVRNLSRAQLSNLTPLCGSISGSIQPRPCREQKAGERRASQQEVEQSVPVPEHGASWASRERERPDGASWAPGGQQGLGYTEGPLTDWSVVRGV